MPSNGFFAGKRYLIPDRDPHNTREFSLRYACHGRNQVRQTATAVAESECLCGTVHPNKAYLDHPILGPRLIECTTLVNNVENRSAEDILGYIDAVKFRSSMTLFAQAVPQHAEFQTALNKFYGGEHNQLTLQRI